MAWFSLVRQLCAMFLDRTNIIVTGTVAAAVLYTKSSGVLYYALSTLVCAIGAKILKKIVRQARPPVEAALRVKKSYGMPSTHSASATFLAVYSVLACWSLPIHPSIPLSESHRLIPIGIIIPWAAAILISRVRLGYHTWPQVVAGCSWGVLSAAVAFRLWIGGLNEYGRQIDELVYPYWPY